jgi:hypothetical protein
MASEIESPQSEIILQQKINDINKLRLKGTEIINEFSKVMTEWDPRIISQSVRSNQLWRQFVADDQQQQQQQQQVK